MIELLIDAINARTLAMVFAAIAAMATVLTLAMPLLSGDTLGARMKAVALEREKIRQRERERLARRSRRSPAAVAQAVHADDRRAIQPEQMGRPGRGAAEARAGRLSRPGALRHLSVLPPGDADCEPSGCRVLPVRRPRSRPAADGQDRHLHRRDLCRHAPAADCSSRTRSPSASFRSSAPFPTRSTCC